jgi:hypothetical protein
MHAIWQYTCKVNFLSQNIQVYIFPTYDIPSVERIRVFIEYEKYYYSLYRVEEAILAFEKLYDRYFAGKIINVRFYDEDLYSMNNLCSFKN